MNVLAVLENNFCTTEEYVLIFEKNNVIYTFSFRLSREHDRFDYLGKYTFTKE